MFNPRTGIATFNKTEPLFQVSIDANVTFGFSECYSVKIAGIVPLGVFVSVFVCLFVCLLRVKWIIPPSPPPPPRPLACCNLLKWIIIERHSRVLLFLEWTLASLLPPAKQN